MVLQNELKSIRRKNGSCTSITAVDMLQFVFKLFVCPEIIYLTLQKREAFDAQISSNHKPRQQHRYPEGPRLIKLE